MEAATKVASPMSSTLQEWATMARRQTRSRASAGLLVTALAVSVVSGCGGSEENRAPGGSTTPSSALISDAVVGGTVLGDGGSRAASAGPDASSLLGGATDENTKAYHRGSDAERELALVGTWKQTASSARSGLTDLDECVAKKKCSSEPLKFSAKRLAQLPEPTTAFSSVYRNQDGTRISIKRSYTYLKPEPNFDGTLVMVSLQRQGTSDPSTSELTRLTNAQVAKTKAAIG